MTSREWRRCFHGAVVGFLMSMLAACGEAEHAAESAASVQPQTKSDQPADSTAIDVATDDDQVADAQLAEFFESI